MTLAGTAVGAVLLVLAAMIVIKLASGDDAQDSAQPTTAAPAEVTSALAAVPVGVLDAVGVGSISTPPKIIKGEGPLTDNSRPLVVYIGAEYCPYCAAERWAMVVALSRFGTFSGLGQTHSSSTDVYPNTATLSFHGASYTSQYLAFQGVETLSNQRQGNSYAPLDIPTNQQQALITKFNAPPYVASDSAGSIPFVDFANQALISGASYNPQVLSGKTAEQIAAALTDATDPVTQAVGGTANAITTVLCQLTNNQPGAVCTSRAATAFRNKLLDQS